MKYHDIQLKTGNAKIMWEQECFKFGRTKSSHKTREFTILSEVSNNGTGIDAKLVSNLQSYKGNNIRVLNISLSYFEKLHFLNLAGRIIARQ